MCLITFVWKAHPVYKLILAANRDEFYARPTAPLGYWQDQPGVLGGRDLKEGGTWMGVNTSGKFSAITNYRDLSFIKPLAPTRGNLTLDFLRNGQSSVQYFQDVQARLSYYNGFNLLTLEGEKLFYFNNIQQELIEVAPGLHGLSNAFLNTPWPKVEKAKAFLQQTVGKEELEVNEVLEWMGNTEVAPDDALPATGVSRELESSLSAMCIETENYGTCCTTVVTITHSGVVNYVEKTYAKGGRTAGVINISFPISVTP